MAGLPAGAAVGGELVAAGASIFAVGCGDVSARRTIAGEPSRLGSVSGITWGCLVTAVGEPGVEPRPIDVGVVGTVPLRVGVLLTGTLTAAGETSVTGAGTTGAGVCVLTGGELVRLSAAALSVNEGIDKTLSHLMRHHGEQAGRLGPVPPHQRSAVQRGRTAAGWHARRAVS